ncbi:response regulator [Azospirillum rugosum]|uniref:DNA-binding NtrC family response regulator n=1 Tax=Azospirillum rugosum TaxID=416170 RepID=A0ABS4SEI0_9PROT|nr:response regulator [Azospirillum rugosum]MBP2290983.1 DNA-binding NtrC family response regulator [Azospirillum rugosum]MDQ0524953.1 DNA-binding NtrC family response regulator [Azospirillum rugosum]
MSNDRSNDQEPGVGHSGPGNAPGGVTVAFLEDDMVLRLCVETVFEDSGIRIVGASTPTALLDALRARNLAPDILVTDHHVGGHGVVPVSVPKVLAAIGRPIPVIVTTGDESLATKAEIRRGGWHFLSKPYDPETLQALIHSALLGEG